MSDIPTIKLILLGDSGVGKSTILATYFKKEHHISTAGVEFAQKTITRNNKNYKLQVWDTAGQEQFMSITPMYFRNVNVCLLVFDLTNKNSYRNIESWMQEMEKSCKQQVLTILVGNKQDLPQISVDQEKLALFCVQHKLAVYYISALEDRWVNELIDTAVDQFVNFDENTKTEQEIRQDMEQKAKEAQSKQTQQIQASDTKKEQYNC